jgi:hypothetical protein
MNIRALFLVTAGLLITGCVSKTQVQSMIDANHETVVVPRLESTEQSLKLVEQKLAASQRLTEAHRDVLIRHFELLQELSEHALSKLKEME